MEDIKCLIIEKDFKQYDDLTKYALCCLIESSSFSEKKVGSNIQLMVDKQFTYRLYMTLKNTNDNIDIFDGYHFYGLNVNYNQYYRKYNLYGELEK